METPAQYFQRTKARQQRALAALGHSAVRPAPSSPTLQPADEAPLVAAREPQQPTAPRA